MRATCGASVNMPNKRKDKPDVTAVREVVGPACIREGHWQRAFGAFRGRFEQEREKSQIQQYANEKLILEYQARAGLWYWEGAQELKRSQYGQDSIVRLQQEIRIGTQRAPMTAWAEKWLRHMISVESYLSQDDRSIIRQVCGNDRSATEVMREMFPDEQSPHFPIPRLRTALTNLDKAITTARSQGYPFTLRRVQSPC
jgi:hypothetical protein